MCKSRAVKYQLIQHRLLEPEGSEPDFTRGTLEGDIAASDITFYRLQCNSHRVNLYLMPQKVKSWMYLQDHSVVLVFSLFKEMGRFYRHVLIEGELSASRSCYVRTLWKTFL